MNFYKNFLYGLILVSCIGGSIFAKGGHKSGDTTIILNTPSDGAYYALYKQDVMSKKITFFYPDPNTTNQYTFNPKINDSQWFNLVVYQNNTTIVSRFHNGSSFANHRYWDWTVDGFGNETLDPR
ncbi:hypothetical protein [Candidatus Chromulinivorax destructor]|uniref:Uncharacterized protein n=1 Tax=Candidatus Chromulinivorax destructor TaxID=2066483 RepID=A0A345ZC42_9BACT|nr:hypothetical protein [Candidatus Chromulinivorax destructor]AXK60859.1 hypothetical protein C0J27_03890 [Candidatus Chromulinivorax destructor]